METFGILWWFSYTDSDITLLLPTKTTATKNEVVLSYHRVRGLYFLAVFFCEQYMAAA